MWHATFNFEGFGFKAVNHDSAGSASEHGFDNLDEVVTEVEEFECLIDVVVGDGVEGLGKIY